MYKILPLLGEKELDDWISLISETSIGVTFAIIKQARFVVSFQSGIGMFASYLGIPTTIFYRAKGDSVSPNEYFSCEESGATAWVSPKMLSEEKHMGMIYGRNCTGDSVLEEIKRRGW